MNIFKRTLLSLLIFFLFSGSVFAQDNKQALVVYYSRTGNTKSVAQKIAAKFNADIEPIIDKRKRTGPIGYMQASKDAVAKNLTTIEPIKRDLSKYKIIIIGTPSWYGNMTPAIRTFLKDYDLSGKSIAVFGTAHLTGVENACKQITETVSKQDNQSIPVLALRKRDLKDGILAKKINDFYLLVKSKYSQVEKGMLDK
jgi:flavodoxin